MRDLVHYLAVAHLNAFLAVLYFLEVNAFALVGIGAAAYLCLVEVRRTSLRQPVRRVRL